MKSIEQLLKDADPLRIEPPLDAAEIERMRRTVLTAARDAATTPLSWRYLVFVASMAAIVIAAVATLARREPAADAEIAGGGAGGNARGSIALDEVVTPARQMQFLTPGGTRVIWIFNPDFAE